MIKSLLLIIMISNGGFWSSGEEGRIAMTWAVADTPMPPAVLSWQLLLADVELASGARDMTAGENDIRVKLPETRVTTELQWRYQLKRKDNQQLLQSGSLPIHAVPPKFLARKAQLFAGRKIVVLDEREKLPALLTHNGIAHQWVQDLNVLELTSPDFIIIGENQLAPNPLMDNMLIRQARRGAGVVVFRQAQRDRITGQVTVLRAAQNPLAVKSEQLLPDPLTISDLNAWMSSAGGEIRALRVRVDSSALPLAYFVAETLQGTSVDCAIVSLPTGAGRIVLCQLPMGDWRNDLRSQLLLSGILDYLVTPTEETKPEQIAPTTDKSPNIYPKGDSQ